MADDKNKGPLLPISGVLLILAALGVTMFVPPFKGTRPSVPELRESYEKINARLWQDPFRAVMDSVKDGKEPQSACLLDIGKNVQDNRECNKMGAEAKACEKLKDRIKKEEKKVTVLGVMVPGAPYAEDAEIRMRLRYAVLSGLSRVGFIPDDPEHIEYVKIAPSKGIALSNIMPFEWLTHTEKEKDSVLILWINDNFFGNSPLLYLQNLACYFEFPPFAEQGDVKFKVIGPATSNTLREMVKEVLNNEVPSLLKPSKREEPPKTVEIYSAIATVDNTLLVKEWDRGELPEGDPLQKISGKFKGNGFTLMRTILPDRELAAKLVEELNLRRVDPKDKKTHLVLVAEWDTYYGRSFRYALEEAIKKNGVLPHEISRRLHCVSYLRGIDGSLPGEKEDKKDEKVEAKSDPLKEVKNLEQPVGKSQYDYLRRLAEETYLLDQDLQANGGEIKAIGVVGTDFYDKFLVLQALRQRFPDVIFFTTDLDARFLHSDNIKWTRNLVVASNFNLSLRKDHEIDIQGEIPPFRDNYQTSVFLAVLRAFSDRPYLDRTDNDQNVKELINAPIEKTQPLIFEIGRYNPVLLTALPENSINPRKDQQSVLLAMKILLIVFLILCFLFFTSARINKHVKHLFLTAGKFEVMVHIMVILVIIVFAVSIYLICNRPNEEPFSIFEGISVWPTEIFRFLAILLSALFIYWTWSGGKKNRESIPEKLEFKEEPLSSSRVNNSSRGKWAAVLKCIKSVAQLDWMPREGKEKVTLNRLWIEYGQFEDQYHFWRVFIIAIFYLLLCGLIIISFGIPVRPLRGPFTSKMDIGVLSVSVILFIVLISYVFDATRCCRKFIATASNECSKKSYAPPDGDIQVQIDNQWALIRLIAMRTDVVGKFIFYPFIVWLVIFVSRFHYFDNWGTPVGLAVVISLGALYAWACAFLLRQSAEGARACAVAHLKKILFDTLKEEKPAPDRIKHIGFVLGEVRSIKQGAFAPFTQHPIVQSLLVPFGGVGGIYLIDFFTKMNI